MSNDIKRYILESGYYNDTPEMEVVEASAYDALLHEAERLRAELEKERADHADTRHKWVKTQTELGRQCAVRGEFAHKAYSLRETLGECEAMLSLLRYRGGVRWGEVGLPSQHEVDVVIERSRKLIEAKPAPVTSGGARQEGK